jgi:hypothetical protein
MAVRRLPRFRPAVASVGFVKAFFHLMYRYASDNPAHMVSDPNRDRVGKNTNRQGGLSTGVFSYDRIGSDRLRQLMNSAPLSMIGSGPS